MFKKTTWPLLSLLLTACVTINIYFPAAAAEQAARVIVRDVLKNGQAAPPAKPEAPRQKEDHSSLVPPKTVWVASRLLEWLVPAAEAAGRANIEINTPAIARLRKSMANRQRQLGRWYQAGAIGFDESGLVTVRSLKSVPLNQRNRLRKLVADENRDRNALYREIARANGHSEWEQEIRKTFARIWVEEAPKGYWYKQKGAWKRK